MMMMMMEGTGFSTIDSEDTGEPVETNILLASITSNKNAFVHLNSYPFEYI